MRSDIDRAVERYTEQRFRQAFEGEPYVTFCDGCGDDSADDLLTPTRDGKLCAECMAPCGHCGDALAGKKAMATPTGRVHIACEAAIVAEVELETLSERMTQHFYAEIIRDMRGDVKGAA